MDVQVLNDKDASQKNGFPWNWFDVSDHVMTNAWCLVFPQSELESTEQWRARALRSICRFELSQYSDCLKDCSWIFESEIVCLIPFVIYFILYFFVCWSLFH